MYYNTPYSKQKQSNTMLLKHKKILVTGGAGFLGSYVVKELLKSKVPKKNIFVPRSQDYDLREKRVCKKVVKGMDVIIHLAANVGGIGKNLENPGKLFYDNITMGVHLIHSAMEEKVEKIVLLGSICAYPKYTPIPFREDDLWMGYPEETNAPYGLAKKMLLVQAQGYRTQYGLNSIYLLSVNLYGPKDNFDPNTSHVIPALIKKIHDAIKDKKDYIEVWGDGSATREFLHVEDAARAIVLATKRYNKSDPINIGYGKEIAIKDLVELIAKLMKFKGKIRWDTTKPNGQPRRCLDVSKAERELKFRAKVPLETGLKRTIYWYLNQRKIK